MAAHRHPGKRHGGLARWGTGLTGVVVGVIVICAMARAARVVPIASSGGAGLGEVGPGATVSITAAHVAGLRGIYPGGTGDVVVSIANRNDVAVRVTAVDLPSATTYATGYTTSAQTPPRAGCAAANSGVVWAGSASGRGSLRPLATPLAIAAHQTATVAMKDGALMKMSAPAACEATYFAMPELIGIGARTDTGAHIAMPSADSWVPSPK